MRLANALCRYVELASTGAPLEPPAAGVAAPRSDGPVERGETLELGL
jgi:hypothetical protein